MKNKPTIDPLLADLATHLKRAGDAFTKAVHYLRVIKLLAHGQVAGLGNQSDLDNATPEQKAAWTLFVEISSIHQWFEQAALDFKDFKGVPQQEPAQAEDQAAPKTDDTPTVH